MNLYVDNLTLTGIVIFVIAVAFVVSNCMCGLCGGPDPGKHIRHQAE
jgi:hypothetical protein